MSNEEVRELFHRHQELIVNLRDKCECMEERLFQEQKEAKYWQMKHQHQLMAKKKIVKDLEEEEEERQKLERYCQCLEDEKEEAYDELYQMKNNLQKGWLFSFLIKCFFLIVFIFSNSGWMSVETCQLKLVELLIRFMQ